LEQDVVMRNRREPCRRAKSVANARVIEIKGSAVFYSESTSWRFAAAFLLSAIGCSPDRSERQGLLVTSPTFSVTPADADWDKMSVDVTMRVTLAPQSHAVPAIAQISRHTLTRERRTDGVWRTVLTKSFEDDAEAGTGVRSGKVRLEVADDGSERRMVGPDGRVLNMPSEGSAFPGDVRGLNKKAFDLPSEQLQKRASGGAASRPIGRSWSDNMVVDTGAKHRILLQLRSSLASARPRFGSTVTIAQAVGAASVEIDIDTLTGQINEIRGRASGVETLTRNTYMAAGPEAYLLTRSETVRKSRGLKEGSTTLVIYENHQFQKSGGR
jgi:hypothetical protein